MITKIFSNAKFIYVFQSIISQVHFQILYICLLIDNINIPYV
jgi:hypothetical protein